MDAITNMGEFPSLTLVPTMSYGHDRRCSARGCDTILCRYNPGPQCWPCQGVAKTRERVGREQREITERIMSERKAVVA